MKTIKEAKAQARILKKFLQEQGLTLSHGLSLEAVARLHHHKTWAQFLLGAQVDGSFLPSRQNVADWPVFVFTLKEADDDLDESFHVLPAHATLDSRWRGRWGVLEDDDAVAVGDLLRTAGTSVVVKAFQSRVPSIDKYGLPWYADEHRATTDVKDNFAFAAVSPDDGGVDVSTHDSGDDSGERVWFEAHVHPDLARKLRQALVTRKTESITDQSYHQVFESAFGVEGVDLNVSQIMDTLTLALRISGDVDAQAHLNKTHGLKLELLAPFEFMTVRQLYVTFVRVAKENFEALSLAALG